METAGIEPAGESDATDLPPSGYANQVTPSAANALHDSDTKCLELSSIDATLRNVILKWHMLPANVRQAIIMLTDD